MSEQLLVTMALVGLIVVLAVVVGAYILAQGGMHLVLPLGVGR
jgi:flagellar motor component MotA